MVGTAISVYTTEPTPPPLTVAAATLPYTENGTRFQQLANVALDTTGTYTLAERIEAQQTASGLIAQGQLRGIDTQGAQLTEQLNADDLALRQQTLQQGMTNAVTTAADNGELVSLASYDYFTRLSEVDQQILFNLNINLPDRTGRQAYPSIEAYRQQAMQNIADEAQWRLDRPGEPAASRDRMTQVLEALRVQPVGEDRALMDQLTTLLQSNTGTAAAQTATAAPEPEAPSESPMTPLLRPGLLTNLAI